MRDTSAKILVVSSDFVTQHKLSKVSEIVFSSVTFYRILLHRIKVDVSLKCLLRFKVC